MKRLTPTDLPSATLSASKEEEKSSEVANQVPLAELFHVVEHNALRSPPFHDDTVAEKLDTTVLAQKLKQSPIDPAHTDEIRRTEAVDETLPDGKQERQREAQTTVRKPHNFAQRFRSR